MRTTSVLALLLAALSGSAQIVDWQLLGNGSTAFGTNFLGTTDDERLTLRTYDKFRLVVNEEDAYTIGSFTSMPAGGFIGISPSSYFWDNGPGPFSRLHLAEPGAAGFHSGGYRPWMRNGISLTGNSDQMYVGQKYTYEEPENPESGEMDDFTDAIIQWSDNPGTWLSDRMRFIFTSVYNSDPTGNGSMEGLEAMQLFPDDSGSEVLVGIGDWYAAGVNPDERLDVLDRTIRIRKLVDDYEDQELEKFVVTDETGRLHWRDISNLPDNCEWTQVSSGTWEDDVWTAFGTNPGCPDGDNNVGIGTNQPGYKLHVVDDTPESNSTRAIYAVANGGTAQNTAIFAEGEADAGTHSAGLVARAYNGTTSVTAISGIGYLETGESSGVLYGVRGATDISSTSSVTDAYGVEGHVSASSGTITTARGVHGKAEATATNSYGVEGSGRNGSSTSIGGRFEATSSIAGTNYGVFASANSASTANWAGWFSGNINVTGQGFIPGAIWTGSDAMFKTNVQPLTNAVDVIAQLDAHTYDYLEGDFPMMDLPSGNQGGLIAQELELVLPSLVTETTFPAQYDDQGNQTSAAFDYKAVNYTGLIPYLIGAIQEQQQQIAAMQQDLAACCENRTMQAPGGGHGTDGTAIGDVRVSDAADQRLTITPNPFSEGTVIGYTLPKAGMVSLQVSDASGKSLFNLFEGQQMEGTQRYAWNTSFLAPGMYHVTLLVDGLPLVKKAVKVAR